MEEQNEKTHVHGARKGGMPSLKTFAAVTLLYLVIALAMFYPITLNMGKVAPGSGADSFQNLWDIWWVRYALFNLHTSIYSTNLLFWPVGANLVYQTMPPLTALLSAPFQLLGTVPAYNIIFMLGFAFSGITMFVLADYLVKNKNSSSSSNKAKYSPVAFWRPILRVRAAP